MSYRLNWLLSAAVAFGTTTLIVPSALQAADDDKATSAQPTNDQTVGDKSADRGTGSIAERTTGGTALALPAGATQSKELANAASLSGPIVGATNQALDKNGLDDMTGYFVDQDRDRLKGIDKIDATALNGRIDQVAKAWKDKYGDTFDADERDFTANQAVEGEIADPAQFVQAWPAPVVTKAAGDQATAAAAGAAADAQPAANRQLDRDTEKNGNIEKGRNVAIVRLPAEGGLPAMDVSLIREAGGWKIDIPNNRTAQQIHDDVQKHLSMVGDMSAQWPGDQTQARRTVARHVLMGIYGIEMPQGADAAHGAATPQAQ
jgi:hypothetical protein